ncbi:MAG: hypothetical protein IJ304_05425 [Clostridia bacterium]|nr:hypothetical protein [Clostridia bacterium]
MEENKNLENEIAEEVVETVEEVVETAEEVVEEVVEETEEITEEAVEAIEEVAEEATEEIKKGSKKGAIIAVIVAVVIIIAAVATSMMEFNPYNKLGYVDISGKTIQDIADEQGVTLAEFLAAYQLPADMPGDTTEANAYYSIPTGIVAEMNGLDFATLQTMLKLPEGTTAETPWGEAEGGILLADYIGGADKVDAFKEQYGFGDEVTAETPWGEIRNAVDTIELEKRQAEEAAAATGELVDAVEE